MVEMVAAARAHDMLAYPLPPRLDAVLAEVAAGTINVADVSTLDFCITNW